MYGPHLSHFEADARILMNIPQEMSVVISGTQIQAAITFIDVNQRNDIRPSLRVDRADVRDPLSAEELLRIFVGHQALFSVHLAAGIRSRSLRRIADDLPLQILRHLRRIAWCSRALPP